MRLLDLLWNDWSPPLELWRGAFLGEARLDDAAIEVEGGDPGQTLRVAVHGVETGAFRTERGFYPAKEGVGVGRGLAVEDGEDCTRSVVRGEERRRGDDADV